MAALDDVRNWLLPGPSTIGRRAFLRKSAGDCVASSKLNWLVLAILNLILPREDRAGDISKKPATPRFESPDNRRRPSAAPLMEDSSRLQQGPDGWKGPEHTQRDEDYGHRTDAARRDSRAFQRLCSTAHAISQTIVASVVRPDTPPAGAYIVGAAKMPASLRSTTAPIANAPMPPPEAPPLRCR